VLPAAVGRRRIAGLGRIGIRVRGRGFARLGRLDHGRGFVGRYRLGSWEIEGRLSVMMRSVMCRNRFNGSGSIRHETGSVDRNVHLRSVSTRDRCLYWVVLRGLIILVAANNDR
jgi:hypothetical protein